jgi:hypothetical protein
MYLSWLKRNEHTILARKRRGKKKEFAKQV